MFYRIRPLYPSSQHYDRQTIRMLLQDFCCCCLCPCNAKSSIACLEVVYLKALGFFFSSVSLCDRRIDLTTTQATRRFSRRLNIRPV